MADSRPNIPYGRQWIDDDDVKAVEECLRGDWLTQGPAVEQFEKSLCQATNVRFAVAVSSGTAALHLAALCAGMGPEDSGITSPITFVASANAMLYAGSTVQFADVDPDSALIRVEEIERISRELARNGKPPKLIVPVDMSGHVADLPAIRRIADKYGSKIIEDAAHSLGATYTADGKTLKAGCCEHSDMAILSFHPVKQITTGEGGAIVTNDEQLYVKLKDRRTHGIHRDPKRLERQSEGPWYYEQDQLGFNYRITDLQCALGLSQLKKLNNFLARRWEIAARYDNVLNESPLAGRLLPLQVPAGQKSAYHLYVVRVTGSGPEQIAARRKKLYLFLRDCGIFCQIHYIPVTWQPYFRKQCGTREKDCPSANAYYAGCLSLPMYPKLSDSEQDRVIEALREWARA